MSNPFALDTPAPAPAAPAAPAPATVTAPPAPQNDADPFAGSDPAPQAPRGPRLREMYGRLVIIMPKTVEKDRPTQFKNPDGSQQKQDRMTADVIVLDGGTIHYGGRPEDIPSVPHDKTAEPPAKWADMFISAAGLISQCREALAKRQAGQPGMVLGRLTKGQDTGKGNPPWILTPATDADKVIGKAYLANVDPFA